MKPRLLLVRSLIGLSSCAVTLACHAGGESAVAAADTRSPAPRMATPPDHGSTSEPPHAPAEPAPSATQAETRAKPGPSSSTPKATAIEKPSPPLPVDTTVLHIGDSFAGALGIALNKQLEARGIKGVLKYETASYIPTWAHKKELSTYLARYQPDLVLINLGANELEVQDPTIRIDAIRRLVERIGSRPCVWIGVPLWDGARGALLDVIREHCAPCVYMDSNQLVGDMDRARDNIHPSMPAREDWAHLVLDWLARHRTPTPDAVWAIAP